MHDFPFVVFIRGDFAEFQTIPEGVGEVKVGTIFLFFFCSGSFGALEVLDVEVVIVSFAVDFIVGWTAATHIATGVEKFAGLVSVFVVVVVVVVVISVIVAHNVVVDLMSFCHYISFIDNKTFQFYGGAPR